MTAFTLCKMERALEVIHMSSRLMVPSENRRPSAAPISSWLPYISAARTQQRSQTLRFWHGLRAAKPMTLHHLA